MRSLLLAVLLLVAPLPIGGVNDETFYSGEESILLLPEGQVWGQANWDLLSDFGFTPLRLISASELLVWKVEEKAHHPTAIEFDAEKAIWSSLPHEGETVRVVLEPGLPSSVILDIHERIQQVGSSHVDSVDDGYLPSIEITWTSNLNMEWFANIDGVLWLEPVLITQGRNLDSGAILSGSDMETHPAAWTFGLNGSGVVIGVADTGIDSDHSCFRNISNASIGFEHRKLLHVNTTIDEWDSSGHADYRHGTHTAGILGCHPIATAVEDSIPTSIMSLGYGSQLVVQDIVSEQGWQPPDVDLLLAESALYGGYLHSNSWGDDTTDYTLRSGDFDAFTREFPWTLPLIAPGNNGGLVLEPANARNVIAIGAATKDPDTERWISSVHGPTDAETRGIFALAPGVSIVSARSDGSPETYNTGQHTLSGTSMSTPMAATYASVIQQMVQEGWLTGHNETLTEHSLANRAPWFDADTSQHDILLGDGFTPSAPMMKALLSLSATPLGEAHRNGGDGGSGDPNVYDGWGILNLSEIIDFERLGLPSTDGERPISNVWIHDSIGWWRVALPSISKGESEHRNQSSTSWRTVGMARVQSGRSLPQMMSSSNVSFSMVKRLMYVCPHKQSQSRTSSTMFNSWFVYPTVGLLLERVIEAMVAQCCTMILLTTSIPQPSLHPTKPPSVFTSMRKRSTGLTMLMYS